MVRITNGQVTLTVTRGAYNNSYRSQGFITVESALDVAAPGGYDYSPGVPARDSEESSQVEIGECDEAERSYSEIPLSEMGFQDLCDYADELGIDREGIRSKKELRALIRSNM